MELTQNIEFSSAGFSALRGSSRPQQHESREGRRPDSHQDVPNLLGPSIPTD